MFQLLNPIWLSAIAALSIPVAIHLWNIRRGKTLRIGSISLIEASSRKSSRSFNLMDILLLVLRCLFLLILALLLAQPYWSALIKSGKAKGWILIPRQNIHQMYSSFKPRIDSLTKAGYELHYLNDGFALIDTAQLKTLGDSTAATVKNWVLLKQLSQQVPADLPLYLFTTNSLNSISGTKPGLGLNVKIQTFTPTDSTSKWINNAVLVSTGDAIKITEGNSKPSGTSYTNTVVQSTEQRSSPYQININNGQPSVSFKKDSANKTVDTTTLRIAIYSDKSSDADYLKAALNSIKQFTNRKINIQATTGNTIIPGKVDWLFWLRERRVPVVIGEGVQNILAYEPGKVQTVHSWIKVSGHINIDLTKQIASEANENDVIWSDGYGKPVLSVKHYAQTNLHHFYTRFDPAWNDLVWSDAFPQMIFNLIYSPKADDSKDRRTVSGEQLTPKLSNPNLSFTEDKLTKQTDLSDAFWLLLVLLFATERWLAHHKKQEING